MMSTVVSHNAAAFFALRAAPEGLRTAGGYASRSEYWWVALAQFVLYLVLAGIYAAVFTSLLDGSPNLETYNTGMSAGFEAEGGAAVALMAISLVNLGVALALLIPTLSVTWRRLHDAGFPGPFYFLALIPVIGPILLLVFLAFPTRQERHKTIWTDPIND
ncbi:DUF805 domain-containing protein [Nesterenkonia sandarakina]|uniref:Uncharacterized membrane protein YhaH (DUF805 family) n=1 Tax=Nesterenkonia sandarakina TaxID=272918 RepID=A0A7Z0EAM1_9MICC|nr:DUF805 domain-containing protein [Nesterenkonia sandarakina]NYJ18147.1 uncharacterized membrane protein YhaH (DUF805 family) [Nesterenkonia sandarakina]